MPKPGQRKKTSVEHRPDLCAWMHFENGLGFGKARLCNLQSCALFIGHTLRNREVPRVICSFNNAVFDSTAPREVCEKLLLCGFALGLLGLRQGQSRSRGRRPR